MVRVVDNLFSCCTSCQETNDTVKTFEFRKAGNTNGSAIMLCDKCRAELKMVLTELEKRDEHYEVIAYNTIERRTVAKFHDFNKALDRALRLGAAEYCVVKVQKTPLNEICTYYDHFSNEWLEDETYTRPKNFNNECKFED